MSRQRSKTHPAAHQPRPQRRIHDEQRGSDAGKLHEPTACPDCGATYRTGRWSWEEAPSGAHEHACPACERIANEYPAGELRVEGRFVAGHRDELMALLRHVEERERSEHPLKRIMAIETDDSGLAVTVTDAGLVTALGHALERAYKGELDLPRTTSDVENLVRGRWRRD